ncbi:SPOR domain-containing protein [Ekhidna sp. To15]|uniref:SPOR domain-containing protein n=1 Tax=Ekhidna sp. To15 TaxID=3395267 RepID=UPI003F525DC2
MNQESNSSGKTLLVIVIIVVVLAAATGIWYFGFYKPEQQAKEQARLEQIAIADAEQKRKEKAAQDKVRYDQLIGDADAAFDQEDWETARSLYSDASALLPNEQYPKDQLVLVNAALDEIATLEAKKAAGIVETVSTPSGRYFIIVSSSIDEDLATDYAKKLAQDGADAQIIEHDAGKNLYYRVALGNYPTLEQAQGALPSFSNYGAGVWILKY